MATLEMTTALDGKGLSSSLAQSIRLDRNLNRVHDLSDADLEVIPAKPPTASAMRAVERAAGAENAWGRVTARVLGVGKT